MLDMNKYSFFTTKNKVIAVSTYAGKVVRGVAKCNPEDEFDLEKGSRLAAARCNAKIATKRVNNARKKFKEADKNLAQAMKRHHDMKDYLLDSIFAEDNAYLELEDILNNI